MGAIGSENRLFKKNAKGKIFLGHFTISHACTGGQINRTTCHANFKKHSPWESAMANDWYYKNANGTESGPLSAADLKQLAQTGQIDQETLIKKGGGSWVKASQIKGIPIAEPKIQAPKIIPPPLPKTEAEIVEIEEAEEKEYTKPKKKPKRTNQNNQTKQSSFGLIKILLASGILLIILI